VIRVFIAIEITDELKASLEEVQNKLRRMQFDVRVSWVKTDNIHLTLQFLGDVETDMIKKISKILTEIAKKIPSFDLEVQGIGCFPNNKKPRVLWVGCQDASGQLQDLVIAIRNALLPLGFEPERRDFSAHLTLGRIKHPCPDVSLTKVLSSFRNHGFRMMRVDLIHLFQSQLHSKGAIYSKLSTHRLGGSS